MARRRRTNRVALDKTPAPAPLKPTGAPRAVKLELSLADDVDAPKWVHVATEGIFLGYHDGDHPFQFTRETFTQIQTNARSHPSFVAGATGEGSANVIPWDFEHASEQPSVLGSLPATGAPAQGWVMDFDVRDGSGPGKSELWALTKFLPIARDYIRAGQYQWASVAVAFDATHPVTGEKIGAICTSIALTNTPFIEGMGKLVASKTVPGEILTTVGEVQAGLRGYYEVADSPMDAIKQLRELFDLGETSGVDEVLNELVKVAGFVAAGTAPLGVDTQGIVGAIRKILGMSPLTPADQVMVNAVTGLQGVIENAPADLTPPSDAAVAAAATAATTAKNEGTEIMDELLKALASALECRGTKEAVTEAVAELAAMRSKLVTTLSASDRDSIKVVLENAASAADARGKLSGILKALGVEDSDGGVQKIADLMKQASDLEAAMPELAALRDAKEKAEEAEIESDVDQAVAATKSPNMKEALLLLRKSIGHAAFVAKYPAPAAPAVPAGVTASVATTPQGTELKVVGHQVVQQPATAPVTLAAGSGETVPDLSIYPGDNLMQQANAYLAATLPNWSDMTYDDQSHATIQLKRKCAAAHTVVG